MFKIRCENCNYPIEIACFPNSKQILCSNCDTLNRLKEERYYYPRLIVIQGKEKGKEYLIPTLQLTLGRGKNSDIKIPGRKASRKHAVIRYYNGKYWIEDLNSGNGTYVNNERITKCELKDKDYIKIGDTSFIFKNTFEYSPILETAEDIEYSEEYLFTPHHDIFLERSNFEKTKAELKFDAQHSFLMSTEELKNITDLENANTKLRILYEVNHAISSILDLEELLKVILDVVFQYIPAERGAILLYDDEDENNKELKCKVIKVKNPKNKEALKISKTILRRVTEEKVSLLTTDALIDERLADSRSIVSQGIKSAMSVPLISKDNLLGVLYIDSTQKISEFNTDTLELLTGIAGQASIAIENARLIKKIEKEIETRGHLQRYLSPELVEQVVNKKITLDIGGQLKKATILFTDLRGFTRMTEHIGAEAVVQILNDYFTRMVDIIFKNKGTLDKFIGDAIMAIWGIPLNSELDSLRAVKTGIEMEKELFYFNISQKEKGRNILKMGAGINTGEVVVGNMGSPKRMEYTVIGPPVNLASRIESLTKKNQVLISDNVFKEVKENTKVIKLKSAKVKGIEYPVQIYKVISVYDIENKKEIIYLPIILKLNNNEYEGMIENFITPNEIIIYIEPIIKLDKEMEIEFYIDIPDIISNEIILGKCVNIENKHRREEEFKKVDVKIEKYPKKIENLINTFFTHKEFNPSELELEKTI